MSDTVLILGATGRFGRNAASAFGAAGWAVRAFRRGEDLTAAANGVDVIVNAWNPRYDAWAREVPKLTETVIAAARSSGATVILPGNVYVFGTPMPTTLGADTPHRATNTLGRIRVEMEAAYRDAGVRTIVLRGGDFLDTEASGNWFDMVMTKSLARGRLVYPGDPTIDHAWAYLPDMTRAAVQLAEMREQLAPFEDVPFPGYTLTGQDLAQALARVMGRPVGLKGMSWLPVRALALVQPMMRGILEMRYLWNSAHRIDPAKFDSLLPDFRPTPLEAALASAIQHQVRPDKRVTGAAIVG